MAVRYPLSVSVKPIVYVYLALLLFILPFSWLLSWLLALAFHEMCHWIGVRLCGGRIYSFSVTIGGANMEATAMNNGKRLISILCGPLGGLLLLIFSKWIPRIAICSWFLSIYNLLPILPLDGGQALQILIKKQKVYLLIEGIVLSTLIAIAIYTSLFLRMGILPLLVVFSLWYRNRKIPCKEDGYKVQ